MAKSNLIKDLTKNKVSLTNALERLLIITYDLKDKEIKNWVLNETNGYDESDDLPNYRLSKSINIKYDGINGSMQVKNTPLPITHFPKEIREKISNIKISEGIAMIEKIVNENHNPTYDLTVLAPAVYKETGIQCLKITHSVSWSIYEKVYSTVRLKVIEVLLNLEKEFGILDDLDIKTDDLTKEEIEGVEKEIISIIADGKEVDMHDW